MEKKVRSVVEKRCTKCGETKTVKCFGRNRLTIDGLAHWCKECYMVYRAKHKNEVYLRNRAYFQTPRGKEAQKIADAKRRMKAGVVAKKAAYNTLKRAVESGAVARPDTCSRCGNTPIRGSIQGHHNDYTKPLEVVWFCQSCHKAAHAELAKESCNE